MAAHSNFMFPCSITNPGMGLIMIQKFFSPLKRPLAHLYNIDWSDGLEEDFGRQIFPSGLTRPPPSAVREMRVL